MSFGFNVRCCMVVESYSTLFTYFAQTLNCLGTVIIYVEGGGGRKIGGAGLFLISKEGSYCYFLVQR